MTTYEKIQMLCRREGFAISNLGEKVPGVKITRGAVSGWKKGAVPSAAVIKAVSEYFDVTPEYLTTEGAEAAFNTVNGNNNIIGNGNTVGNSLHSMLKNEKYIGVYSYKDQVRIEGGVPAIIEPETFAKVQEMLKINKRAPAHTWSRADYILTDKLFCGHCGSKMAGESGTTITHTYEHPTTFVVWRNVFAITVPVK